MRLKITEAFLRVWPQWVVCLTLTLLSFNNGLAIGWTSPYIAQLTSRESVVRITDEEASWIVSLLPFGRLFGAVIGSLIMEYYGGKKALLAAGLPIALSWICIIFANSAWWLYVSRTSAANASIRGALVSTIVNGMPLGTLIGNAMGSLMSMMSFGLVSLVAIVCFLVMFLFLPQSPHYYVRCNDEKTAKKTIQWYHRKSNVNAELQVIEDFVRATAATSFREKLRQITVKKNRRGFVIIIFLFIFMQLSGLNTVVYYMETIVRSAQVTSVEPATVVILSTGIGIVVGWISVYLIDRCGRRALMTVSCGCVIMAMILLGVQFMLLEQNFDPKRLEWLPILAMILFMMMSIGLVPVPSTILSELFPDDLKSIAGFTASITSALFAFICSKTYQPLIELMTEKCVFWMYAIIMTMCLVFTYVAVPETKGKTLQEIQEMLSETSKKRGKSLETKGTVK
ncbi:unnamed protein product [Xylocopa violacea]|uniref:Major facilitator superfamily (MFS) profile domain-containing protein n=1 Tax=Xylocopa violacea TaxID=135666 RepID=A0ABP1PJA1_XYLVO